VSSAIFAARKARNGGSGVDFLGDGALLNGKSDRFKCQLMRNKQILLGSYSIWTDMVTIFYWTGSCAGERCHS
jgi:hypothetical protein